MSRDKYKIVQSAIYLPNWRVYRLDNDGVLVKEVYLGDEAGCEKALLKLIAAECEENE